MNGVRLGGPDIFSVTYQRIISKKLIIKQKKLNKQTNKHLTAS